MSYVSTYFSPNRGTADKIIGFIDRCSCHIDAAVYSLTHDKIADSLIRAHQRGVPIRLLMDKVQAGGSYADDERLKKAGLNVRIDNQSGLMHHKFIIDGGKSVGTGSFNWTASADERNAENYVVIRLKYVVEDFQSEFDKLWELNAP